MDDPAMVMVGLPYALESYVCTFMLVLDCLGFRLAYKKAFFGTAFTWIGASFSFEAETVRVCIKPEVVQELLDLCTAFASQNLLQVVENLCRQGFTCRGLNPC
eukprot:5932350-Amphidinium_carterae.1